MGRECVFCQIIRKEQKAHILYEDEETLAFLDIHPLADGHAMVVPKAHFERLEDLPPGSVGAVFQAVQRISKAARQALEAPATTVGINNGAAAGQVVPHLHVHIVPRRPDDGGGTIHSVVGRPAERGLAEVRELLAKALS